MEDAGRNVKALVLDNVMTLLHRQGAETLRGTDLIFSLCLGWTRAVFTNSSLALLSLARLLVRSLSLSLTLADSLCDHTS